MEFAGKVVLVTGATSGIGQAIAMAFAAEGALVLGGGRSAAGAAETERLIAGRGGTFRFVATDISAENEAERAVQTALDQWGRLDCAVNNAAIGINAGLLDYTVEDCDRILATNVRGLFLCLRAEIRAMHQAGSGAIVTIGSAAGHRPYPGNSLYNASKSAASMLTRSAALEFAPHGIRINEVAPGPVRTPMLEGFFSRAGDRARADVQAATPLGISMPADIADAVLFLCSTRAAHITGAVLSVDGGFGIR